MQREDMQHPPSTEKMLYLFLLPTLVLIPICWRKPSILCDWLKKEKVNKRVSSQRNFGALDLSIEMIRQFGHREVSRQVTFRALALRSYRNVSSRFDGGLKFETSALESLYGGEINLSLTQ